jgi:hypothetical protein
MISDPLQLIYGCIRLPLVVGDSGTPLPSYIESKVYEELTGEHSPKYAGRPCRSEVESLA